MAAPVDDLSCQALVELVTDYLENHLSAADRASFEAHLARCGGCQTFVEHMRQTIRALGRVREQDLAPEVRARLFELFRGWRRTTGT
jgi:anti-sigma factor RsiW